MEKFKFLAMIIVLLMYFESVKSEIPLAPALYVFGDSIFDSGNNNVLPTLAKADFKPYGSNFDGGRATGRFTNGKTVADFIAEFLGLPFSPPYLSLRGSLKLTGLNYASGSCGILPYTGNFIGKCLHFSEQVDLFQRTVERELPRKFDDPEEFSSYLSRSIFVVSTGNNDYVNNYLQPNIYGTSKRYTPDSFAKLLIDTLSQQLQASLSHFYDLKIDIL
uniref:Uncharacterized protein n=1 Tax=Solanum lycopersicum TaxID=4081 RepID=A0A3Q7EZW0_SOLLC